MSRRSARVGSELTAAQRRRRGLAGIARIFGLVAVLAPAVSSQEGEVLLGVATVGLVWAATQAAERRMVRGIFSVELVSAAAVGLVCAVTCDLAEVSGPGILGVLAIPPVTGAILRGAQAGMFVLGAGFGVFVTVACIADAMTIQLASTTFTWLLTGIGFGLIGAALHSTLLGSDQLAAHRTAQGLIHQLASVSDRLGSPLEPEVLGTDLLNRLSTSLSDADLPARGLMLQAPNDGELVWVAGASTGTSAELALRAVARARPAITGHSFALPLLSDGRVVAVVSGHLSPTVDRIALGERLQRLGGGLEDQAVVLETALLFTRFRNTATVAERRRLAREIHDGVAQDLASVGYLLDAINGHPDPLEQAQLLDQLRGFLGGVLSDLRRALVELRTDTGPGQSLGAALDDMARHVQTLTGIAFHVRVDEQGARLRPEVESELLRIGQEAITNAVRHSGGSNIWVTCRVAAPYAEVSVSDDGCGLGTARADSHGLQIMRERARLIGAELLLTSRPGGGVVLKVRAPGALGTNDLDSGTESQTGKVSA
ncbi:MULTISPECIES: sensor histidine kinase [unclassified Nocardioides]|uniref:sensor histidine kinase n=1 Tax=unclassified Nocardioides TaxID=2615069 RepID=UPI0012E3EFD3|nr:MULTISPECIES: sensor histidine kinase [unclassified Nocardioides]